VIRARAGVSLAPLAVLFLAAALAPAAAAAAQAPPPGAKPPAGPPAAAPSSGDSGAITVYLPQPSSRSTRPAPPIRRPPRESGLAAALAAAVFLGAGLAWLAFRSPTCPRCRQKLVRLERSETSAPIPGEAVPPLEDLVGGARRDPWACLACGVVMRRRFGPLVAADAACPSCGAATKKTRLAVVEHPGYLTWGEVRLDEDCLTCAHRASTLYAAPPLEAPTAQRGAARSARGAASRSSR
jgi:hypothetical protein